MPVKTRWYQAAIFVVSLLLPLLILGRPSSKSSSGQDNTKKDAGNNVAPQESEYRKADALQYVGSDTCKTCHEDVGKGFEQGPHWKTNMSKHQGPQWQGCEACHGPGKEHAESGDPSNIIRFPSLTREEASKRCLGCHEFTKEHANFLQSEHLKNNVGCVDCHAIHHPQVERKLLRASQPMLCYSCHLEVKKDSKPFHQRVNGELTSCTNCHNPHGGLLTRGGG